MKGVFELPETLARELEHFKVETERFKRGELPCAKYRAFRVPHGVYEQREEGRYMLRVRLPGGLLLPKQMRKLGEVSKKHGNGVLHVTTRQDIQVHRVGLDEIHPALVALYDVGMSTKGGGGNTVRNITACFDAGVCAREAFDVTPHAVAATEFLLRDPLSFQLPRKYKLAFSGCGKDCGSATMADLGFIAKVRDGEEGFAVYVGGGMGAISRVADKLEDFVGTGEIFAVSEAVKRVFDKHGNRKNRNKARLRFLLERIGLEGFRELYEAELAALRKEGIETPSVRAIAGERSGEGAGSGEPGEGFEAWRARNVVEQKQPGRYLVHVQLVLGDIEADTLAGLADVVEGIGEGMVRTTPSQNMVIRCVGEGELAALHGGLGQLGLAGTEAPIVRNAIACAGAATCKLGICLSRGLVRAIVKEISRDGLDLAGLGEMNIHVSGCPNSCGRHPVGQIGLFGAARRLDGRLVPHYVVQLGGRVTEGKTQLAEGKRAIPARNVPTFVADLLAAYQESNQRGDFDAFCEAEGEGIVGELVERHKPVPSYEEDPSFYVDWDAKEPFSLAGRGPGECGAGVFELIEVDLASAHEALKDGKLFAAAALSARALLVTQGLEAKDDGEALALFRRHFVEAELVAREGTRRVVEQALASAKAEDPEAAFAAEAEEVSRMVEAVQDLYDDMDPSLRFTRRAEPEKGEAGGEGEVKADREADFRGVACPLNYVKTKLLLERMGSGEVLSILLDGEGARNVPDSAEAAGHTILSKEEEGDHWRVVLRKGGGGKNDE